MAAPESERFPLDLLDAETEGMIGLELGNRFAGHRASANLMTMEEVPSSFRACRSHVARSYHSDIDRCLEIPH